MSVAAHVGVFIAAIAHAHSPYLAELHALREVPVEVRTDDIDLLEQAEPAAPVAVALPAAPSVHEPPPHAVSATAPAAPREVQAAAPTQVEEGAPEPAPSLPHFVMVAPVVSGVTGVARVSALPTGNGSASAVSVASGASAPEPPVAEQLVDTPAKLLQGAPPSYTAAAESAGIEAELPLEVVIDANGSVQTARPLTHVGYGLDEAALSAVRHYRFAPARRANKLVAVRMRWVMRFQLR